VDNPITIVVLLESLFIPLQLLMEEAIIRARAEALFTLVA
jgi:hypothetical protein